MVVNGDFEEYNGCPSNPGMGNNYVIGWSSHYQTPDYFHRCGSVDFGVPSNFAGNQDVELDNSAYIGIATYWDVEPGFQEIVRGQLSNPLQSGVKYRVRFKASMGDSRMYSTCCVGIVFSSTPPPLPPYTANISDAELVIEQSNYNTNDWFILDTTFIAEGGEDKIYIGAFRPESEMGVAVTNDNGTYTAYYYIDDVEVYEDDTVTDIAEESPQAKVRIWFDVTARTLVVNGAAANALVRVHDAMGRLVATGSRNMDVSGMSGFYVVRVYDAQGHELEVQKVILY